MPNTKYQNEEEYYKAEIERMINNCNVRQQKTLRSFLDWYGNKTSIKTGKPIALKTKWNNIAVLQNLGKFLKNKDFKEMTQEEGENWLKSLNGKAATSIANWKVIIRYFFKYLYGIRKKHTFPKVVDTELWETPTRPKPVRIQKDDDVLSKDDLLKLKRHTLSLMDKCKIEIGEETGLRANEIASLNYGGVKFDGENATLWIRKSKTKTRKVKITDSVPTLKQWLNKHAFKEEDSPLFYGQRSYHGRRLNSKSFSQMLKQSARRAGIDPKKVWWHGLRHVSITGCRRNLYMDVDFIAKRHGISPDTVRKVYLHYSDDDANQEYIMAKGGESEKERVKRKEELMKTTPKKCNKCKQLNPADFHFCENCQEPLDWQGFSMRDEEKQKETQNLKEQMAQLISRMAKLEQINKAIALKQ